MMTREELCEICRDLEKSGHAFTVTLLLKHDREQREALAEVEDAAKANLADERRANSFAHTLLAMAKSERDEAYSQLAEALKLLGWSKYQLMLWEDYQVENGFEVEDHYVTGKVRQEVETFLAGHGQAEQQKAREPVPARPEHGVSMDEALALTMDRYSGALEKLAASERQESQGAQAGDDERQAALKEMFQVTYAGDILEILGRLYDAGYRRAALATQPEGSKS